MRKLNLSRRGFTLVELSIVLVIIGLIIGGVLTGQQIIQNARVTKTLNDIQAYQAQFQTYVQNYGALPGNDSSAVTRFGAANNPGLANGSGSGVLVGGAFDPATSTTTTDEALLAWADLRAAGLVKNQISNGTTAVQPPNPFNGVYGFQNGAFGANGFTTTVLCMNNVPLAAAEAIDSRLDDGIPNAGSIEAVPNISSNDTTATSPTTYGGAQTYILCIRM